jgi:hypothetical protein
MGIRKIKISLYPYYLLTYTSGNASVNYYSWETETKFSEIKEESSSSIS